MLMIFLNLGLYLLVLSVTLIEPHQRNFKTEQNTLFHVIRAVILISIKYKYLFKKEKREMGRKEYGGQCLYHMRGGVSSGIIFSKLVYYLFVFIF